MAIFYGWWIVVACFLISFYIGGITFFGFTAFIEPIRAEFGWSYTQISFASSLRGLEMGLFSPLIGFLVDRFGSRKMLFAGVFSTALGLTLLAGASSLFTFYLSFLFIAFGAGGCTTIVTITAVTNWFQKNLGLALGIAASGYGASGLIIPPMVWLIDQYGWRTTLFILALGTLLLGIPLSLMLRNRSAVKDVRAGGGNREEIPAERGKAEDRKAFSAILKDKAFMIIFLVEGIRMMIVTSVVTHIMPYLSSLGVPRTTAGFVAAGIPVVSIFGRFGFGWLGDLFGKRNVMIITLIVTGLGLIAFCYITLPWVLALFLLLFCSGYGGAIVLRGAMLRDYFEIAVFGKALGLALGAGSVGGLIGPTLTGWIYDVWGNYIPSWIIYCAFCGLAIALLLRLKPAAKGMQAQ